HRNHPAAYSSFCPRLLRLTYGKVMTIKVFRIEQPQVVIWSTADLGNQFNVFSPANPDRSLRYLQPRNRVQSHPEKPIPPQVAPAIKRTVREEDFRAKPAS